MEPRARTDHPTQDGLGAGVFARDLHLSVPDRQLLTGATFAVPTGRRAALVGRNGSGKSTLLQTILALATDGAAPVHVELGGTLELGPGTRVASLPQSPQLAFGGSVAAYLDARAGQVGRAWHAHERLSAELAYDTGDDLLRRYGEALEAVQRLGAWDYPHRRLEMLAGLGLGPETLDRAVATLSGGEATRLAMAGVLLAPADLVLLDEPTNNLDLPSIRFLSRWVRQASAGLLVVSHDRDFLDEAIEEILEVEERTGRLLHYGGNFTFYLARKAEELQARMRAFDEQENRRARLESSMAQISGRAQKFQSRSQNDFYRAKGAKVARLARAQTTRIERELGSEEEPRPPMPARFTVLPPTFRDGILVRARGLEFGHQQPLFAGLDLSVGAGRRLAVVGPNGSGKTTLLRLLAGELDPEAGHVERVSGMRLGHLRQVEPPPTAPTGRETRESLLDHVLRLHPVAAEELRSVLGKVLFADPGRLRARDVSEGERRRAECAALFLAGGRRGRGPDLVLLDEPTNHLDLSTIEMLEGALGGYRGAVIAVSHDSRFLRRLHPAAVVRFGVEGGVEVRELSSERDLEVALEG
jgi:ATPase subunit of ABC transporter with duplicated ATPase domains